MRSASFDYIAPNSLDQALDILRENEGAALLAGGHSLLLDMKLRRVSPSLLVDLRKVGELRGIRSSGGGLRVGAMATCSQIADHPAVVERYAALAEAAGNIGDVQVRNRSTLAGNLAYNDPAGDLQAVALVLQATINVAGPDGSRSIPAASFFVGPRRTDLGSTEIITSVDFPAAAGAGSAYEKFKNPANGYAVCGVAASVIPEGSGHRILVAVGGAVALPSRLAAVEAALAGKKPTAKRVGAAVKQAGEGLTFVEDLFASADYRAHLTQVLAEQALLRAAKRAGLN